MSIVGLTLVRTTANNQPPTKALRSDGNPAMPNTPESRNTPQSTNPDAYGRLDVTIGETSFEAGKQSPVTILLRNPFDVPVEVMEIRGPRSYRLREADVSGPSPSADSDRAGAPRSGKKSGFWKSVATFFKRLRPAEVSFAGVTLHLEEVEKVTFAPQPQQDKPDALSPNMAFTIQPHCEALAYFAISTTGWLFFTPIRLSLSTQVRYRINGKEKTQVASSDFEVKPPLGAMVFGTICGALLGSLAKALNSTSAFWSTSTAVTVGGSLVMSLIAVIALARKTGTQGFITVEDFFGGFVVGALIGYGGSSYFEKAITPPGSGAPGHVG